ncbi:hypothetical protein DV704_10400 [Meiothermus sp. QL-1]|uniref:hypothetical protein n=1 Tax=Meiothermus sp. QL-1 TaxID=2058095 RepID=UPI000E0B9E70|nr:hypothetical protein [Meiothermus sp. QL-1]RDI94704.1 hypothetical protein DV704_10400 [Meiothermus sp. QL-1]
MRIGWLWLFGLFLWAQAQEAALYRGFAELRLPQELPPGEWVWTPEAALFESLVPGTLRLLGVSELSRRVEVPERPSPLEAYVGKEVQFYWEGQWRRATLVSAERNLFLYEGRYLVGLPGVVAYPDPSGFSLPPGPRVVFRYRGEGRATLAFLTRALRWGLYWTLEDGELVGWATLTNGLKQPLRLVRTELVAGSVPLLEGGMEAGSALRAAPALAEWMGEAGGTYRYRLAGEVLLEPGQTELPFLRVRVEPVYLWRWQGGFSTEPVLAFVRGLRFSAPEPLAAGLVGVREKGVFIGQATLPDTPKGRLVTLLLGPDPEGQALRQVEALAPNRFRVTTTVRNPKAYGLTVEIEETLPQPFALEGEGLERLPQGYRLRFALAPNQSRSYTYTLTLERR